ncbi:phosphatidylserine synthase [Micromonospora sp. Llam0]|uniref:CDP-alcohol phosphatidyltransferase family protein n=1 Tax=Micromonospora sp. Llam0 TaxID=2485143 RepID=UPI000F478C03|nr:CDP-alcohol phosphatidyltransferase family protein [Micromonospora sp. Llam0]ROO51986.1 phosphatidylserine synthase [Micromonospora sp. Llam0]
MIDARLRPVLAGPLDRLAAGLDRPWITPGRLTAAGLALGLAASVAAAAGLWWWALAGWLLSRLADGLDGPLARRRDTASPLGGFLDIVADFTVYGAFVAGVAVGVDGSATPFLVLLVAYYVNGAALLAYSSIAERLGRDRGDERSLHFLGGLAEGAETVAVHSLFCLFPGVAGPIAWVWAAVVAVTAGQRVVYAVRTLSDPDWRPTR